MREPAITGRPTAAGAAGRHTAVNICWWYAMGVDTVPIDPLIRPLIHTKPPGCRPAGQAP